MPHHIVDCSEDPYDLRPATEEITQQIFDLTNQGNGRNKPVICLGCLVPLCDGVEYDHLQKEELTQFSTLFRQFPSRGKSDSIEVVKNP
jgi:hypothetical protein